MSDLSRLNRPVKAKGVVHHMIADTAKGMAEVIYEDAAHDNDFYKRYPDVKAFVRKRWQSFIQPAREQLAEMLGMPDSMVSAHMKAEIHEALLLNAAVNPAANFVDQVIEGSVH